MFFFVIFFARSFSRTGDFSITMRLKFGMSSTSIFVSLLPGGLEANGVAKIFIVEVLL